MHYNGPIVRPQTDANSVFIEVTIGCSHDGCTFCNFYNEFPFRVAPLEHVEADLKEASIRWPDAKNVWASGGNPYALSTNKLARLAELFRQYMPQAKISTYAHIKDLLRKSVDDMKYLKNLGFGDLVIGVESGDDDVLKDTNKGYTSADILEGCHRLDKAGVSYRIIYLGGLAGKGKGVESAIKSAGIINQINPYYMYLTTASVLPDTKLYEQMINGEFVEESEKERLEEFHMLITLMDKEIGVFSQTSTVTVPFVCQLPRDRERVLTILEQAINSITDEDEKRILDYRRKMTTV